MLNPQLLSTCHTFLPDIAHNGNVVVLMKDFYCGPLNTIQIVIVRHKPIQISWYCFALQLKAGLCFFFQDDKDVLILDISPEIFEKRPKRKKKCGNKMR